MVPAVKSLTFRKYVPVVGMTAPAIEEDSAAKLPLSSSNSITVVPSEARRVSWLSVLLPAEKEVIVAA